MLRIKNAVDKAKRLQTLSEVPSTGNGEPAVRHLSAIQKQRLAAEGKTARKANNKPPADKKPQLSWLRRTFGFLFS